MLIPPSLVQHDKSNSTQDGPQSLTTWPLTPILCYYQPLLSCKRVRPSIPTPRWPLCRRFLVLLIRSSPGGPIQKITTRAHPSRFHGKCSLFISYYLYLDPTRWQIYLCPFMPISIHWIYCSSFLSPQIKQGPQHDSLSFWFPNQLYSSRWPPRSLSYASKTSL